ncbi:MAG: class I SAM-dependent methyltransferase [Candidatus Hydrogenedentales bacterium]
MSVPLICCAMTIEHDSRYNAAGQTVKFQFLSRRSRVDSATFQRAFREPPLIESGGDLPHHMDSAHARVFADAPVGTRLLEVGCSEGRNRTWFTKAGFVYFGTDIYRPADSELMRTCGGPGFLSDAHFFPVADEQFDIVYCAAVTEHLACPHLAFQEMRRVLKPGGYFLGNVAFLEPWHADSFFHMSPNGVIELLTLSGFQPEYVWPSRGYSVFDAAAILGFRGPFRAFKFATPILNTAYRLQFSLRRLMRSMKGKPPERPIDDWARMAGAIDWIARKPS